MKVHKITVWRGVSFKTANKDTIDKWKKRQLNADRNGRFAFPIKIKELSHNGF